tara:strand:- start:1433 stop:2149 length:717 start_codon:yes stop_codon:yes gene_type:complete
MSELKLNSPLSIEDIELRIGQTSAKGFSLLLYKTARTDVKRLDDVYGTKWKNRFFYDAKNLLCCEISIYDLDIKEWVSRVDVGTESQTEAEKGSYSDAFKRAGFKWNIGSELYQSPFIWITWNMKENNFGGKKKYTPDGFFQSNLAIDKFDAENGQVKELIISYNGKGQIFTNKRNGYAPPVQQEKPAYVKQYSMNDITELAKVKEFDLELIENAYGKKLEKFDLNELNKSYKTLQGK